MKKLPFLLATLILVGGVGLWLTTGVGAVGNVIDGVEEWIMEPNVNSDVMKVEKVRLDDTTLELALHYVSDVRRPSAIYVAMPNYQTGKTEAEFDVLAETLGISEDLWWSEQNAKADLKDLPWIGSTRASVEMSFTTTDDKSDMDPSDLIYYAIKIEVPDDYDGDMEGLEEKWIRGKIDLRPCIHVNAREYPEANKQVCVPIANPEGKTEYWPEGLAYNEDLWIQSWVLERQTIVNQLFTSLRRKTESYLMGSEGANTKEELIEMYYDLEARFLNDYYAHTGTKNLASNIRYSLGIPSKIVATSSTVNSENAGEGADTNTNTDTTTEDNDEPENVIVGGLNGSSNSTEQIIASKTDSAIEETSQVAMEEDHGSMEEDHGSMEEDHGSIENTLLAVDDGVKETDLSEEEPEDKNNSDEFDDGFREIELPKLGGDELTGGLDDVQERGGGFVKWSVILVALVIGGWVFFCRRRAKHNEQG